MQHKIESLQSEMLAALKAAGTEEAVRDVEVKYLGRTGLLSEIMKGLKDLSDDEKRTVGRAANEAKKALEEAIAQKYAALEHLRLHSLADAEWLDVTVPGQKPHIGHRHPLSKFMEELEDIFAGLGFSVAEGPEVETEHYNFNQLNIPPDHPARDMQDTFWIKNLKSHVLRTQTSAVQIRHMESHKPPLRIIGLGKTFRKDSDATHSPMFHQCEGLMVGGNISMANLKSVLTSVMRRIFANDAIKIRFRVSFFPFVEPGMEVDCTCPMCLGSGKLEGGLPCRLCKQCGWLEVAGAGMVHARVLKNVGYDPEKVTGFAFGIGLDRMVMIRHKINHLRLFFENDLRFLHQF